MFELLRIVVLTFLLLYSAEAWDCRISPKVLHLHNATFRTDQGTNRGVNIFLPGNQFVGLRATFAWNNTRIRSSVDCEHAGDPAHVAACQGASGSTFDQNASPLFTQVADFQFSSQVPTVDPHPAGNVRVVKGIPSVQFEDLKSPANLPVEIWSDSDLHLAYNQRAPNKSFLAFGAKSSVLQSFLEHEIIPSSFVGFWFGSRSVFSYLS